MTCEFWPRSLPDLLFYPKLLLKVPEILTLLSFIFLITNTILTQIVQSQLCLRSKHIVFELWDVALTNLKAELAWNMAQSRSMVARTGSGNQRAYYERP